MMNRKNANKNKNAITVGGLKIEVRNGNVEQAIKKLRKKTDEDGRLKDYSDRCYYQKPSDVRREEKKKAVMRHKKKKQKELEELEKMNKF